MPGGMPPGSGFMGTPGGMQMPPPGMPPGYMGYQPYGAPGARAGPYGHYGDPRQRAEAERAREEEERRRREAERRDGEKKSATAITRIIQKVRYAAPENLEQLQKDLETALEKELPSTGDQKERLKTDGDRALDQIKRGIVVHKVRVATEEAQKARQARIKGILEELDVLVKYGEDKGQKLLEDRVLMAALLDRREGDDEEPLDREAIVKALETAAGEAEAMAKARVAFFLQSGQELQSAPFTMEMQSNLIKLRQQVKDFTQIGAHAALKVKVARERLVRYQAARAKTDRAEELFKKYDRDSDGVLAQREVRNFALSEHGLELQRETLDRIWRTLVDEGSNGVKLAQFQGLRVAVGVAREVARDKKRPKGMHEAETDLLCAFVLNPPLQHPPQPQPPAPQLASLEGAAPEDAAATAASLLAATGPTPKMVPAPGPMAKIILAPASVPKTIPAPASTPKTIPAPASTPKTIPPPGPMAKTIAMAAAARPVVLL